MLTGIWGYYGGCVYVGSGSLFSILLFCVGFLLCTLVATTRDIMEFRVYLIKIAILQKVLINNHAKSHESNWQPTSRGQNQFLNLVILLNMVLDITDGTIKNPKRSDSGQPFEGLAPKKGTKKVK